VFDWYSLEIAPLLRKIDVRVKELGDGGSMEIGDAALLLEMPLDEAEKIAREAGVRGEVKEIDRRVFFIIMREGSSAVCRFYAREIACGSPESYTASQISYIYSVKIQAVRAAFDLLRIKEAGGEAVPAVLSKISVKNLE
jgi:hypothetical protein